MSKAQTNMYPCGCVSYGRDAPVYCPSCNKNGKKDKRQRITYQDYEDQAFAVSELRRILEELPPAVR